MKRSRVMIADIKNSKNTIIKYKYTSAEAVS